MITDEMLAFVRAQREAGMNSFEIERLLISEGGWEKGDVEEAFRVLAVLVAPVAEEKATPPPQTFTPPPAEPRTFAAPAGRVIEPSKEFSPRLSRPIMRDVALPPQPQPLRAPDVRPLPQEKVEPKETAPETISRVSVRQPMLPPPSARSGEKPPSDDFLGMFESQKPSSPKVSAPVVLGAGKTAELSLGELLKHVSAPESSSLGEPGIKLNLSVIAPAGIPAQKIPPAAQMEVKGEIAVAQAPRPEASSDQPKEQVIKSYAPARTMSGDLLMRGVIPEPEPKEKEASEAVPIVQNFQPALPRPIVQEPPASKFSAPKAAKQQVFEREPSGKKMIIRALGVLALLCIAGGAAYAFFALRGPGENALLAESVNTFFTLSSFSYRGEAKADLTLIAKDENGQEKTGLVKFDTGSAGLLEHTTEGYGDGAHRVQFKGGLQTDNFAWSTDLELDARVIDNALYFHVLSLPDALALNKEIFTTHWIKVDLAEIAKELSLQGMVLAQEDYGSFGGVQSEYFFNNILAKYMPFTGDKRLPNETLDGIPTLHLLVKPDPEQMLEFVRMFYRKYANKTLTLSEEERLRLLDALKKIKGEIWINAETNMPVKFSARGEFDDDMLAVRVKGVASFSIALGDLNKPIAVDIPTPLLTMEELKIRMEENKKKFEARERDVQKLERLNVIVTSLSDYRKEKGRYPNALSELYAAKKLATSSVSETRLKEYRYVPYLKTGVYTKAGKCTAKGKTCDHYHLGVNFEDMDNPALSDDADIVSDIRGEDALGCGREEKLACYDVVAPQI